MKVRAYTRRQLRRKAEGETETHAPFRLSKRWQRHDQEIKRNTEGCAPDFENLP